MPTNRQSLRRPSTQVAQITGDAITRWRRMKTLRAQCTCPDAASAPYPGAVYNSADPECVARHELYRIEQERYDAMRAACQPCRAWGAEQSTLFVELGIDMPRPDWHQNIFVYPELVAALDQLAAQD